MSDTMIQPGSNVLTTDSLKRLNMRGRRVYLTKIRASSTTDKEPNQLSYYSSRLHKFPHLCFSSIMLLGFNSIVMPSIFRAHFQPRPRVPLRPRSPRYIARESNQNLVFTGQHRSRVPFLQQ